MVKVLFFNEPSGYYVESSPMLCVQIRQDEVVCDDEIIAVFDGDYWHYVGMEFTDLWISEAPI